MTPFIFKPVFVCVHSENADENWFEIKGTTYREDGNIGDMGKMTTHLVSL